MQYPVRRSRIRALVFALSPIGAAALASCDAPRDLTDPAFAPQENYSSGGAPALIACSDPTPLEKWSVGVGPAGGTFTMGPNTLIVPAGTVSGPALMYLKELSSTSLQMRVSSTLTLNDTVEVIMSTQNCNVEDTQLVWRFDETTQEMEDIVISEQDPTNNNMRFWTIQPGAYALAD